MTGGEPLQQHTRGSEAPAILLIDDEPTIRSSISRLLARAGYRVRAVASGEEALECVTRERFQAVICDLRLPGLRGAALCEQIWIAAPELAGRLIVASGDLTAEEVDGLVERAGVPPVPKPYTAADLLRAVGAICPAPGRPASGEDQHSA